MYATVNTPNTIQYDTYKLIDSKIFYLCFNNYIKMNYGLAGECPEVFEDFVVRKRVENWQFS